MSRSDTLPEGATTYEDTAVVMITRNEEAAIADMVEGCLSALPGAEVIVVDGSEDDTPTIAAAHGARVIREPGGGPAPALLAALRASDRPISVTVDADLTYPMDAFPRLVALVRSGVDVAGTDRLGTRPLKTMPLANWLANVGFAVVASARARRHVRDPHSGQRAYHRSVTERFDWDTTTFAFPVDLLLWPAYAGCKVVEFGIDYHERVGDTTLRRWPSGKATLQRVLRPRKEMQKRVGWRSWRSGQPDSTSQR